MKRASGPARSGAAAVLQRTFSDSAALAAAARFLSGCALAGGALLLLVGALRLAWSIPLAAGALERYFGGPLILEGTDPGRPPWMTWTLLAGGAALWIAGLGLRRQRAA
ncbi:MAG TPA: hypothetical protein VGB99_03810 [Acidobacteriota bacterium]